MRAKHLLSAALMVAAFATAALADTITSNLQLLLMDSGSHPNDWGAQTNLNLQKIEEAIAGATTLNVGGGTLTLSADQARPSALIVTGSLSADQTLIVPAVSKWWVISNQAALGSYSVQIKTPGGAGITVPATSTTTALFWSDGANIVMVGDQGGALTSLTSLISTAQGTANSAYSLATAALPKAGGSMSGDLILAASTPPTSLSAAPKAYVDSVIAGGIPSGAVMAFNLSACPSGWAAANGTAGTVDLRGEFIRGLDGGRGIDSGRTLASAQSEMIGPHTHPGTGAFVVNTSGGGAIGGSGGLTLSSNTAANTGTENRPRNVALLYCQKS